MVLRPEGVFEVPLGWARKVEAAVKIIDLASGRQHDMVIPNNGVVGMRSKRLFEDRDALVHIGNEKNCSLDGFCEMPNILFAEIGLILMLEFVFSH